MCGVVGGIRIDGHTSDAGPIPDAGATPPGRYLLVPAGHRGPGRHPAGGVHRCPVPASAVRSGTNGGGDG